MQVRKAQLSSISVQAFEQKETTIPLPANACHSTQKHSHRPALGGEKRFGALQGPPKGRLCPFGALAVLTGQLLAASLHQHQTLPRTF